MQDSLYVFCGTGTGSPPSPSMRKAAGLRRRAGRRSREGRLIYFSNEQGCSVTLYRLDRAAGALSAEQTITTLPAGYAARNTCSQIHLTPSGRFLYVANRGHNSIAGFAVDAATGRLTAVGPVPTEAVPGAFALDPEGRFLFAAGTASGRLAAYRIDGGTGALSSLETYTVGQRPAAVLTVRLGDRRFGISEGL